MNMFQRANLRKKRQKRKIRDFCIYGAVACALLWVGYVLYKSLQVGSKQVPVNVSPPASLTKIGNLEVKKGLKQPVATFKQPALLPTAVEVSVPTTIVELFSMKECEGTPEIVDSKKLMSDKGKSVYSLCDGAEIGSIRVTGEGEIDLFESCNGENKYWASTLPLDGCVNIWGWPPLKSFKFVENSIKKVPKLTDDGNGKGKYVIAFSCESSNYFGYQVQAALLGFERSGQDPDARFIRLLTASENDDLDYIPTFNAKRHVYKQRYGPLNKPDVITKWYASSNPPLEEIVVIVDPDNWLRKSVRPWVDRVEKGKGVAQMAFFGGATKLVTKMYREFCTINCDWPLKMAAVPYLLHRDDMGAIAPLWKKYTLLIKEKIEVDKKFEMRYSGVQIGWCAEMFAFIFGAAEAGIDFTIVHDLQIRDVSSPATQAAHFPMIHMGRAWFPWEYAPGKQWEHTEGRDFRSHGRQVWCKCNDTASDILPWPLSPKIDLVSEVTLTLLHDSREKYGPLPKSKYRPGNYHESFA